MPGFITRSSLLKKSDPLHAAFFLFLFILVFLGEGKQGFADVVGAAGVLCLFVARSFFKGKAAHTPLLPNVLWAVIFSYLSIHTWFSDSIGYSISVTIRYTLAYLVFVFFSSEESDSDFSRLLLYFVFACTLLSVFMSSFWKIGSLLPGMNLLYPSYGHNNIASLIIFIFPLVIDRFLKRNSPLNTTLLLFAFAALLFSFARGAIIVALGYSVFLWVKYVRKRVNPSKTLTVFVAAALGVMLLVFIAPKVFYGQIEKNAILKRQLIKGSVIANRENYWKQAILAFKDRPLWGAGPGTFYLLSKRYEAAPSAFSWYAHSFPLQGLAETGIAGAVLIFGSIWWLLKTIASGIRRTHDSGTEKSALFYGIILTLVYSMFEMNLDFIVVLFLFSAMMGFLYPRDPLKESKGSENHFSQWVVNTCLGIAAVFYIISAFSMTVLYFTKNQAGVIPLELYNADAAAAYVEEYASYKQNDVNKNLALISFFHQKNPAVLSGLAEMYKKNNNLRSAKSFYKTAVLLDPKNQSLRNEYFILLQSSGEYSEVGAEIQSLGCEAATRENCKKIQAVRFNSSEFEASYAQIFNTKKRYQIMSSNDTAKIVYLIGLSFVTSDPAKAKKLWTLAKDLSVVWSYYYLELASLEMHVFNDRESAQKVLAECQTHASPAPHCASVDLETIPPQGFYRENIIQSQ